MHVQKRDGRKEAVHFDKITARITKLAYGLSAEFCDPVRERAPIFFFFFEMFNARRRRSTPPPTPSALFFYPLLPRKRLSTTSSDKNTLFSCDLSKSKEAFEAPQKPHSASTHSTGNRAIKKKQSQVLVAQKVATGVYKGVTTTELDELAAETAASMTATHPDYAVVSFFWGGERERESKMKRAFARERDADVEFVSFSIRLFEAVAASSPRLPSLTHTSLFLIHSTSSPRVSPCPTCTRTRSSRSARRKLEEKREEKREERQSTTTKSEARSLEGFFDLNSRGEAPFFPSRPRPHSQLFSLSFCSL